MSCTHLQSALRQPTATIPIHKDECTQCFDSDEVSIELAHGDKVQAKKLGIFLCLTCYNGSCVEHGQRHMSVTSHCLYLQIFKHALPEDEDAEMAALENDPQKSLTLAEHIEKHSTKYEYHLRVTCESCKCDLPIESWKRRQEDSYKQSTTKTPLDKAIDFVLRASAASRPTIDQYTEAPPEPCEHTLTLQQIENPPQLSSKGLAHCQQCDITTGLWLCLTCGALGCSRKVYGGGGGNEHAVLHNKETGHPLVLKMGTITPDGGGDVFCYACDDTIVDPSLAAHLKHFGLDVAGQQQTEKTTAQMALDMNLSHNWSNVLDESGKAAELLFGPGYTGISNLGNSCYMASVLQVLFTISSFHTRYVEQGPDHILTCRNGRPADCFHCQMAKLAISLYSGKYSHQPDPADLEAAYLHHQQEELDKKRLLSAVEGHIASNPTRKKFKALQPGVAPRMFKNLVTKDHIEFKTNRQQDALEFLHYFLSLVQQKEHVNHIDPSSTFSFQQQDRIQCENCHGVKYKVTPTTEISVPVPRSNDNENTPQTDLSSCISSWAAESRIEGYHCPKCNRATAALSRSAFHTYPNTLLVQCRRFVYDDWVPAKLVTEITVNDKLDLNQYRSKGKQAGEEELPDSTSSATNASPQPDDTIVQQLQLMGFGENACKRAALAVSNSSADAATEWLFSHMEDVDINDPLPSSTASQSAASPNAPEESIIQLESMGFPRDRCTYALSQTSNDVGRAVEWLFSHMDDPLPSASASPNSTAFASSSSNEPSPDPNPASYKLLAAITHLGKSTGSGHYVAHIWKDGQCALYNDEKVTKTEKANPGGQAYLLVYRREA